MSANPVDFTDDVELLLDVMPPYIHKAIEAKADYHALVEIVLDLGRKPEAYYYGHREELSSEDVSREDIRYVVERIGRFTDDNRAGIERTLHRISAIRNRTGDIIGLTCRIGRAIIGTVDIVRDVIESGDSLLLLGRPGVGKTTLLREAARVLADDLGKRVVIVDTSNEIGGDGDIPHPGIGRARRMQVPAPHRQHAVMIEAVENHMPEVVVIDEIGTEAEALAARTIAERGVQLIATAHGNTLDNLQQNPTLSDLIGGFHAVTLSDEEARRRHTQKTVLERKALPTFNILVEIQERNRLAVYHDVAATVDAFLRGLPLRPEIRVRTEEGRVEIVRPEALIEPVVSISGMARRIAGSDYEKAGKTLRIFTYGVSRSRLERAIQKLLAPAEVVTEVEKADILLTLKSQEKRLSRRLRDNLEQGMPLFTVRSNTGTQMENFLRSYLGLEGRREEEETALQEAREAIREVSKKGHPIELSPQNAYLRRVQHDLAKQHGLASESRGEEPYRRVLFYPTAG